MTEFSRRRKWIGLRNQINAPLKLNPFVFTKQFFMWASLGIVGGIVAGLYWLLINLLMKFFGQFSAGWEVILIMGGGGLIIGLIIHFVSEPGEMDLVVNNVRFNGGRLETRHNPSMIVTSALGIGVGSSAGPEAPMVQVIGSIGSWMAKKLHLKGEDYRSMTIAGMATGFTSMFGAPLGGSLFALEIMHHKHVVEYYQALIPAFVASGTSYIIYIIISKLSLAPVWFINVHHTPQVLDFFWGMFYGVIGALIGWGTIWVFKNFKKGFKKMHLPIYIQTTLAGVLLGILGWKMPITRFFSHYQLQDLLAGTFAIKALIIIIVIKIISMSLTVTSGWRGGFIIPLFFIGAATGMLTYQIHPGMQSLALAIVCCMAAVNSCVTRTPISTILLVATMTGYSQFIPIMFASLTGFFLAPKSPLISAQVGKDKNLLKA